MPQQKVAFTYVQINMNRPRYAENSSCDPLKYEMGSPNLTVSICMGKFIRTKRFSAYTVHIGWELQCIQTNRHYNVYIPINSTMFESLAGPLLNYFLFLTSNFLLLTWMVVFWHVCVHAFVRTCVQTPMSVYLFNRPSDRLTDDRRLTDCMYVCMYVCKYPNEGLIGTLFAQFYYNAWKNAKLTQSSFTYFQETSYATKL